MYIRLKDVLSPRDKVKNLEVYLEKFLEEKEKKEKNLKKSRVKKQERKRTAERTMKRGRLPIFRRTIRKLKTRTKAIPTKARAKSIRLQKRLPAKRMKRGRPFRKRKSLHPILLPRLKIFLMRPAALEAMPKTAKKAAPNKRQEMRRRLFPKRNLPRLPRATTLRSVK